jgi:hypothetical protein
LPCDLDAAHLAEALIAAGGDTVDGDEQIRLGFFISSQRDWMVDLAGAALSRGGALVARNGSRRSLIAA